ncbi:MAG: hypothetical protein ACK5HR_06360 [Mycoplasmatales bacterium]
MKKLKILSSLILLSLVLAGCKKVDETAEDLTDISKENLIKNLDATYITDDDYDGTLGDNNDSEYEINEGEQKFGLINNLYITDKNNDGVVEVGETLHVKFTIKNNYEKDYTIIQLKITALPEVFTEGTITNLTTENTGTDVEIVDQQIKAVGTGTDMYTLKVNEIATYEFDAKIKKTNENLQNLTVNTPAQKYFTIEYVATANEDLAVYYTTNNLTLSFSEQN